MALAQAMPLSFLCPLDPFIGISDLCAFELVLVGGSVAAFGLFFNAAISDFQDYTDVGQALGFLSAFLLAATLLPVTRNSVWVAAAGVPFERAVRFHRGCARLFVVCILAHGGRMMKQMGWTVIRQRDRTDSTYGEHAPRCFIPASPHQPDTQGLCCRDSPT